MTAAEQGKAAAARAIEDGVETPISYLEMVWERSSLPASSWQVFAEAFWSAWDAA